MPTPRILKVVCRGTAELDAKNHFYKVIAPYIESLSCLGAVPRCNPTTLTTRNLDRLKKSFDEDIAPDLNDVDTRKCRLELEVLYILYRALELFELQGSQVAAKFLSDVIDGDKTKADVRFELSKNERFGNLRCQLTKVDANKETMNDTATKNKILELADIVEKYMTTTSTALRIVIAVPSAAVCEEVNKMLACFSTLVTSYVYDTSMYNKNVMKNFIESSYNCMVIISSPENLKGQNIPLNGISLAISLDVQKHVFRRPPNWQGSIYMLVTDIENKSFQGNEVLATSPKKPPATLKRGLANQASRGRKAFLTKEEENYFNRHLKSSTKIFLPSSENQGPQKSQATSSIHLSLSRWRPWQSKLQETYQIGHSTSSQLLVDVFKFCDEISGETGAARLKAHEDELAAHFDPEDVILCHSDSRDSSHSDIGDVDSFDIETVDFLAISSEMDRYVLDSVEKISHYLSELGLAVGEESLPPRKVSPKVSESSIGESIASPESLQRSRRNQQIATPETGGSFRLLNGSVMSESSPLASMGRIPMASTPFAGSEAARANFKMTPIAVKSSVRQQSTPNSHVRARSNDHGLASGPEASRLSLTALVNVVERRKKQKNLQYFFPSKPNQQAQLSDIVEAAENSSNEKIQEPNHGESIEPLCSTGYQNLEQGAFLSEAGPERDFACPEKPRRLFKDCPESENSCRREQSSTVDEELLLPQKCSSDSKPNQVDDDDDRIFEDIEITHHSPGNGDESDCIVLESSTDEARTVPKSDKYERGLYEVNGDHASCTKAEPKGRIRSVFDALDDLDRKQDSYSTHTAVLNIINNIPTRSKGVEVILEEVEPEKVGNILPVDFHHEIKRTLDTDENSDDLFDCVEEPVAPSRDTESQDIVLEKLLKKADARSSKAPVDEHSQRRAIPRSQEAVLTRDKGFRKQKLRDRLGNEEEFEAGESSPRSLKMSFSAPSTSSGKTAGAGSRAGAKIGSKSQKEYSKTDARGVPLVERSLAHVFESRSSKRRKRLRSSSASSEDSIPIQKRRKNPGFVDKASTAKSDASRRAVEQRVRREYFDEEVEVDSIDSVSEDEEDQPNAYELNSFVDDGDALPQSQGMYHRLNRELSPRLTYRRPLTHIPYEDCFSQEPSPEEESYGDDSFVEHGSVPEVTLPAEITIMQAPPEADTKKRKQKKNGFRRAFICEESSEGDQTECEERNRSITPTAATHSKQDAQNQKDVNARNSQPKSSSRDGETAPKNVILANTALLGILPEILVGLQRTFTTSHIEPVDMDSLESHSVDLYLGGLCIKLLTLEQLGSEKLKAREQLRRFELVCERPVLLVITTAEDDPATENVIETMIEVTDMNMRTFFVKNQVELLMVLKCIAKDLSGNDWLIDFLESEELRHLLRIPNLSILTAAALLRENRGNAQKVLRTSSVGDVQRICNVSESFAKTICAAFRIS